MNYEINGWHFTFDHDLTDAEYRELLEKTRQWNEQPPDPSAFSVSGWSVPPRKMTEGEMKVLFNEGKPLGKFVEADSGYIKTAKAMGK